MITINMHLLFEGHEFSPNGGGQRVAECERSKIGNDAEEKTFSLLQMTLQRTVATTTAAPVQAPPG